MDHADLDTGLNAGDSDYEYSTSSTYKASRLLRLNPGRRRDATV